MAKNHFNRWLVGAVLISSAVISISSSFAQEGGVMDESAEIETTSRIREEQKRYYDRLNAFIADGSPITVSSDQCKYVSSIGKAPLRNEVTLTFDDGPHETLTPKVLDILKKYQIKATFFMLGRNVVNNKSIVERAFREGHVVANHSWSHPDFHSISTQKQINEFESTDHAIDPFTYRNRKLFRYPYGNATCFMNNRAIEDGYQGIVGWHIDTCDWGYSQTGVVSPRNGVICGVKRSNYGLYVNHVVEAVKQRGGGIVLMHDVHERTVENLEDVIRKLLKEGFSFTNLDDVRMSEYIRK